MCVVPRLQTSRRREHDDVTVRSAPLLINFVFRPGSFSINLTRSAVLFLTS